MSVLQEGSNSAAPLLSDHADQSFPYEWATAEVAGRPLVIHDEPEGTATAYVVTGASRNVRVLAQQDAVLYDGTVVRTEYHQDLRRVGFCHDFAGRTAGHSVETWLDEPAVCLSEADEVAPETVGSGLSLAAATSMWGRYEARYNASL